MVHDSLQRQRFELKFRISEQTACAVRDFVRSYLDPDTFARARPDFAYPVHSLYLDSPSLSLYWATVNGDCDRFKLRVRYYSNEPRSPAFFEIKSRTNECIHKQRAMVRRDSAASLLAGACPSAGDLVRPDAEQIEALRHFYTLATALAARPHSHVAYEREAWVDPTDSVRLTLDRAVRSETQRAPALDTRFHRPVAVFGHAVILELKFTDRFPNWFGELVQAFGLVRTGAAKYVTGIDQAHGQTHGASTLSLGSVRSRAFAFD